MSVNREDRAAESEFLSEQDDGPSASTPASPQETAQVELLKEQSDVKDALKQTPTSADVTPTEEKKSDRLWFATYALGLVLLAGLYYLLRLGSLPLPSEYIGIAQRAALGGVLALFVVAAGKAVESLLVNHIDNAASRYTLNRILQLLVWVVLGLILISIIFANWYTTFASLGVASVVVGLALQSTLTSFFGWIYILIRKPYKVGDRIQLGAAKGDVIGVSYLDTTLWEFGGPYLFTDHPSGRLIKFPNSQVLSNPVYNYSWPLFPYIWNEIKFNIAYDSDLEFVAQTMREVAEAEIGEFMMQQVRVYRELLAHTPVDELEVQERPAVHFRVGENTWLEAIVRYLVHPKEAGRVKTRIIKKLLARLNAEPDRVLFPKGSAR